MSDCQFRKNTEIVGQSPHPQSDLGVWGEGVSEAIWPSNNHLWRSILAALVLFNQKIVTLIWFNVDKYTTLQSHQICLQHWYWEFTGHLQGRRVNCAGLAPNCMYDLISLCDPDPLTYMVSVSYSRLKTEVPHFIYYYVQCVFVLELKLNGVRLFN